MPELVQDEVFEKTDFSGRTPPAQEYEQCSFRHCNFSNANLGGIAFIDCTFTDCDLALAELKKMSFRDAVFDGCKMTGLHFGDCSTFGLSFRASECVMDSSSFYSTVLKKITFVKCRLRGVDFSSADLTECVFDVCDLSDAMFDNTKLIKADLRGSFGYRIDPEKNAVKGARFSLEGLPGLLGKYQIRVDR